MSTKEQHHQTSSGASSEAKKGKRKVCHCDLEGYDSVDSTAQKEEMKFWKTLERLIGYFNLTKEAMMCNHCLYTTDVDPEYINLLDYPPAKERIPKENIKQFQGRSYVLRGNVIYLESEFQELESAYHEACAELDEAKLELIPLNKKIKLMAGVLYTRQRVYNERPILNPDKFKKMLENSELLLKDASGASSFAIKTLASAGLTVRRETITKQKAWHVQTHTRTVVIFLTENVENLVVLNVDDFHNIHESCRSDSTTTFDTAHLL
ncbi:hypothetical protein C2G38_2171016 [Gigaspora rosea]|uniref:Uncharacterized protein n=1 Tax=Gigaspora rosea TaxID=44941 RepID=A0A397VM27_9GLOM|nr:hypothetical protein C2G38_2171016 [Gigaspora rosea]